MLIQSIIFAVIMTLVPLIVRAGMDRWTVASITSGLKSIGRGLLAPSSVLIALTSFLLSYLGVLNDYSYFVLVVLLFAAASPAAKSAD